MKLNYLKDFSIKDVMGFVILRILRIKINIGQKYYDKVSIF